jgi:hypothetical protein
MSTSNWETSKARSNYHFDKWRKDTDSIIHLGRFLGDWQEQIQNVIDQAKPLNWSNRRQSTGRPAGDVEAEEQDLIKAGADPKLTIYRGLGDFTDAPICQQMTGFFVLKDPKPKLHVQFTGEMLNIHIDKLYDLDADPDNVIRIMVMMQDWEPGQFIMYGNQMFDQWRAGDVHTFDWRNTPHATANASLSPRPMLVITGVKTERTRQILEKPFNIQL